MPNSKLSKFVRQTLSKYFLNETKKNLNWFILKFPDENSRYWAISDYLIEALDKRDNITLEVRNNLLQYIRQYTINKTGLDPKLEN